MGKSIIEQLQLMATVVLAVPVVLLGLTFITDGKHLTGVGFLVIAVLMIVFEEYVITPTDVATDAVKKGTKKAVVDPEADKENSTDEERTE